MKHRIWRCDTCEYRELLSVTRNEYKDVVLTLDGGEVLQFTPRNDMPTPPLERIELAGRGRDSKTKELSEVAFIVLKNPRESFTGNIRVFTAARPPVDAVTTPTDNGKPKTKRRQDVTQSDRTEWTLQALEKVAAIWVAWRRNHNTQTMGGRERDCFEKHKDTLPVCIKTAKDFQNCKECARKHGLIPKHNRKRRKSAG